MTRRERVCSSGELRYCARVNRSSLSLALGLAAVSACATPHTVIVWSGASTGENASITINDAGHGSYKSSTPGLNDLDDELRFTKGQVRELHDLFESHDVCKLKHDPAYTPVADEGKTTLDLSFDDLTCTVWMYDLEWQRPATREIADTMHSMKPLRTQKKKEPRKLDPQGLTR